MEVEYLNGRKLFVIPQFLTPEECHAFIERSEQFGYVDAPINTAFGPLLRKDVRDNQRILLDDSELATVWWDRAKGLLIEQWFGWKAVGLRMTCQEYEEVVPLPHFPSVPRVFYLHDPPMAPR